MNKFAAIVLLGLLAVSALAADNIGDCISGMCPGGYTCEEGKCVEAAVLHIAKRSSSCGAASIGDCIGFQSLCPPGFVCVGGSCCPLEQ